MIVQDTSRREEIGIVEVIQLGHVALPFPIKRDGRIFEWFNILATRHNHNWPGTNSPITFVVEGLHKNQTGILEAAKLWGFFEERECYDFLTGSGEKEYFAWDRQGNKESDIRVRLNIPDAYVVRYKADLDA